MPTFNIDLPESFTVTGAKVAVDTAKLAANGPAFLGELFRIGLNNVAGDSYSTASKKDSSKEENDKLRLAAVQKKVDAWHKGDVNVTSRGSAESTILRRAYRMKLEDARGPITDGAWADLQFKAVKAAASETVDGITIATPEKGKVIDFDLFVTARAIIILCNGRDPKEPAITKAAVDAKVAEIVTDLREAWVPKVEAADNAAVAKVDVTGLDF